MKLFRIRIISAQPTTERPRPTAAQKISTPDYAAAAEQSERAIGQHNGARERGGFNNAKEEKGADGMEWNGLLLVLEVEIIPRTSTMQDG